MNKRYTVLVGGYGSGKTELALSMARAMRKQNKGRVALVDLDVVNPYFRSGEQRALLEGEGVEVYMPSFALSTVDVPALPAQIQGVFEQDFERVVFDVGGDDTGATALGRYAPYIQGARRDVQALFVVNACRPFTNTAEGVAELWRLISAKARLTPDGLINNTNLQEETQADDLIRGQRLVEQASERLNAPIVAVTGMERLRPALPSEMQALFFPIEPIMKPDWLTEQP